MIIKLLLIAAALGVGLLVLREKARGQRQAVRRIVGLLAVIAGIVAILWPGLTVTVASAVGVGRGTDLVLYLFVVLFAYTAATTSQRIHRLERDITVLTRELALSRPARPDTETSPTGSAAARESP